VQASYESHRRQSERNGTLYPSPAASDQRSTINAQRQEQPRRVPPDECPLTSVQPQHYQRPQHRAASSISGYSPMTMSRIQPTQRPVKYLATTTPRQRRPLNTAIRQVRKSDLLLLTISPRFIFLFFHIKVWLSAFKLCLLYAIGLPLFIHI